MSKKATYPNILAFINEHHKEIYDFISGVERFNSQKVGNMRTFYRGMSDTTYKLTAGLYRRTSSNPEKFYFNEIQVRCPEKLRMLDSLEKLVYMQHYGCPTRLLDITSNPLVALYFACVDNSDKDGVVYEFETSGNNVLYAGSDRVQLLAKLAEFSQEDQAKLRTEAYLFSIKDKVPLNSKNTYGATVLERLFHTVKRDNPGFERAIRTPDLLMPRFVQPIYSNDRIKKQDGAFIISGLDYDDVDSDNKIREMSKRKIILPRASKKRIITDLEKLGIHRASLFPEVEEVAQYLKSQKGYDQDDVPRKKVDSRRYTA